MLPMRYLMTLFRYFYRANLPENAPLLLLPLHVLRIVHSSIIRTLDLTLIVGRVFICETVVVVHVDFIWYSFTMMRALHPIMIDTQNALNQ